MAPSQTMTFRVSGGHLIFVDGRHELGSAAVVPSAAHANQAAHHLTVAERAP
jgi:hypothetical protein